MIELLLSPFQVPELRRALVASLVLALSAGPIGVFLSLRRMSLTGDAMSHAILPGVAVGFLLSGLSVMALTIGGLIAGLGVALLSGLVTRLTRQNEDSSFAAFYLISLALGVLLVSLKGSELELEHVLFGDILGLRNESLLIIGIAATIGLAGLALIWRPLVAESLDPSFLRGTGNAGRWAHLGFLVLVVLNLVAGFQAFGALLAVGLMMLPAAASRFWVRRLEAMAGLSITIGAVSAYSGLVIAHGLMIDPGPAIVLVAGAIYLASLIVGRRGIIFHRLRPARHRTA